MTASRTSRLPQQVVSHPATTTRDLNHSSGQHKTSARPEPQFTSPRRSVAVHLNPSQPVSSFVFSLSSFNFPPPSPNPDLYITITKTSRHPELQFTIAPPLPARLTSHDVTTHDLNLPPRTAMQPNLFHSQFSIPHINTSQSMPLHPQKTLPVTCLHLSSLAVTLLSLAVTCRHLAVTCCHLLSLLNTFDHLFMPAKSHKTPLVFQPFPAFRATQKGCTMVQNGSHVSFPRVHPFPALPPHLPELRRYFPELRKHFSELPRNFSELFGTLCTPETQKAPSFPHLPPPAATSCNSPGTPPESADNVA